MDTTIIDEVLPGDYLLTTDRRKLQPDAAHRWLSTESYWAKGIPLDTVRKSIENSFVLGILKDGEQVAFARLVTDYSTFGHLCDVYVLPGHRGRGLSKALMRVLLDLDWVKGLRNLTLGTLDAQGLYRQFGFEHPENTERLMRIARPDIYLKTGSAPATGEEGAPAS